MPDKLHHEQMYRGNEAVKLLREARLVLCGVGALGSNLADNVARQGFESLRVIDDDRVEEHNIGTQIYGQGDIGVWKVEALRTHLFRGAGVEIDAIRKRLATENARKLLKDASVVVDMFDNSASRQVVHDYCRDKDVPCLHVGLYEDYAEAIWNESYRVPKDVAGDVCDYPLARNLVLMAVSVASETLVKFVLEGKRESRSITLNDFAVREMDS